MSVLQLQSQLEHSRQQQHRLPVMLSGDHRWLTGQLENLLDSLNICTPTLFSDSTQWPVNAAPWKQANKLLGQSIETLILDLTEDIPADALGLVTGALRGGGLLLLLCPKKLNWSDSAFLRRAAKRLGQSNISHWSQSDGFQTAACTPLLPPAHNLVEAPYATEGQKRAVTAIKRVQTGHRRRPLVLTADRGRGKSAAMGIAAAQLMQEDFSLRILVTGPSRKTTETLFYHTAELLPGRLQRKGHITFNNSELLFAAPDELASQPEKANLLLVDEAAAIPAPLLTRLLKQYSRIVFASTIHGYEGTGRGFAIRFRKTLEQLTPKWNSCQLQDPVRWAPHDPVEQLINDLLLLDAEATEAQNLNGITPKQTTYITLTGSELADDEQRLSELFGLLIQAHYQTSPDDMRQLLERDDLTIALLLFNNAIAAAALISHEGGFDKELARQIWSGQRRPKGHLLPQTLAAHAGHIEAPTLRMARIMRIAVHPAAQQLGLGQHLVQQLITPMQELGMDILGSSFGATSDLLKFWNHCQLSPVHIGSTRNASSGCHSVVVSRPLSERGHAFHQQLGKRFQRSLPATASFSLNTLESDILLQLFACLDIQLTTEDRQQLQFFADGLISVETCLPELQAMTQSLLPRHFHALTEQQRQLLTSRLLQNRSWAETLTISRVTGKKQAEQMLACSAATLLSKQK